MSPASGGRSITPPRVCVPVPVGEGAPAGGACINGRRGLRFYQVPEPCFCINQDLDIVLVPIDRFPKEVLAADEGRNVPPFRSGYRHIMQALAVVAVGDLVPFPEFFRPCSGGLDFEARVLPYDLPVNVGQHEGVGGALEGAAAGDLLPRIFFEHPCDYRLEEDPCADRLVAGKVRRLAGPRLFQPYIGRAPVFALAQDGSGIAAAYSHITDRQPLAVVLGLLYCKNQSTRFHSVSSFPWCKSSAVG